MHRHLRFPLTVVVFPALLTGCAVAGPEPIALNEDACDYCRMTIADARFGGEAVTRKGRAHKFDSIECLAGWARAAKPGTVRALYVLDAQHPGTFVRVLAEIPELPVVDRRVYRDRQLVGLRIYVGRQLNHNMVAVLLTDCGTVRRQQTKLARSVVRDKNVQ